MLRLEDLQDLAQRHPDDLKSVVREFSIAGRHFSFNSRPYIMGVINLSPDSWYRESVCLGTESALERGRVLRAQGADIIDIGAESTIHTAARLDEDAHLQKLIPVLRQLAAEGIPTSVETYSATVARACLEAGANVVNFTGTAKRQEIFHVATDHNAAVILCYVQGENVREVADFDFGADPVALMREYFSRAMEEASNAGLDRVLIDPGMGFYYRNLADSAMRVRHQMRVFLNTFRLRSLGCPICHALPHAFEFFREEVRAAEPFFAMLAALGKTDLFRTHEVPRTRAVLQTLSAWE